VLLQHNNHRIAFEVQRSPLSPEDWLARRKGYRSIGVHDIWIIVGDRHLSVEPVLDSSNDESAEPVVNPGPLARSLFETDGRVLWVSDAHVDHLRSAQHAVQIPSAADLLITELAGLPHLYDAISVPPGKTRHRFDGAPFRERPEDLIGTVVDNVPFPIWAEMASQPTIPVASTNPAEMEIFHIDFSRLPTPAELSTEDGEANEETTAQGATDIEKGSLHGPWALVSPETPFSSYDHAIQWKNARTAWTRD